MREVDRLNNQCEDKPQQNFISKKLTGGLDLIFWAPVKQ